MMFSLLVFGTTVSLAAGRDGRAFRLSPIMKPLSK